MARGKQPDKTEPRRGFATDISVGLIFFGMIWWLATTFINDLSN